MVVALLKIIIAMGSSDIESFIVQLFAIRERERESGLSYSSYETCKKLHAELFTFQIIPYGTQLLNKNPIVFNRLKIGVNVLLTKSER